MSIAKVTRIIGLLCVLLPFEHAFGADCSTPVDPSLDFLQNFANNTCYITVLSNGAGSQGKAGDLNALYTFVGYKVDPNYEIILLGSFSNSRYMDIQGDDNQAWPTAELLDQDIVPLYPPMVNPFAPGAVFVPNQHYGVRFTLGPNSPEAVPGCGFTTEIFNVLDLTQIHQGGPVFPGQLTGANSGGAIFVRRYLNSGPIPFDEIIVRSTATGCAIPAAQAITDGILVAAGDVNPNLNTQQIALHYFYGQNPTYCFSPGDDPASMITGRRQSAYVADPDEYGQAYLGYDIPVLAYQSIIQAKELLQYQFKAPATPTTPCEGCSRTGLEQMRYFSLSFSNGTTTLASLSDKAFNADANGNVTLIVNIVPGLLVPAFAKVSPYTYLDLSETPNWTGTLTVATLRNAVVNPSFACSTNNVPAQVSEWNPNGGYMGTHGITIQHLLPFQILVTPGIPVRDDVSCLNLPAVPPICPGYIPPGSRNCVNGPQ